jgi:hypothetical protein
MSMGGTRRGQQLERYFALKAKLDDLVVGPEEAESEAADRESDQIRQQLSALWDEYLDALVPVPVSRCPYTGAILDWALDIGGLDGLWWDRDAPARRFERLLPCLQAITGAVRLQAPLPVAPFVCAPGPGLPWVCAAALAQAGMRAVLSSLTIGSQQAYLLAYFLEPGCSADVLIPDWGIDHQRRLDDAGEEHWCAPQAPPEPDFELAPWIAVGKLLWIDAGDPQLRLRSSLSACPYLGLAGRRHPQLLCDGAVWVEGQEIAIEGPIP